MKDYPKILIFYQPFNSYSGGGITLTNLFLGWPKERLAVLSYPFMLNEVSWEVCGNYYQLGNKEFRWIFPLNMFKQSYPSGVLKFEGAGLKNYSIHRTGLKNRIANSFINPLIEWLGLHHCISRLNFSLDLQKWLSDFAPDLIYLQVSNRESIAFSRRLIEYLETPAIIHMMDDWPTTISIYGPLKTYWRTVIDREFRGLLDKVSLHLSISDAMSDEYFRRYNKVFKAFHNPVNNLAETELTLNKEAPSKHFRILYLGRIGTANKNSIVWFANHISQHYDDHFPVVFDIFSKDNKTPEMEEIGHLRNVNIYNPVKYERVWTLMKEYDLLLLPMDFTSAGLKFSKFSIPTKASEYMFSGTPILILAPEETAVCRFFMAHNCGYCVTTFERSALNNALNVLIHDGQYRETISQNAYKIARERFDGEKVRREFHDLLIATKNR
mgnify:FL=1